MTLSFNFACFWSSNASSHNLGVIWRWNQKRKSAGNFFSLDLPNGQACDSWHSGVLRSSIVKPCPKFHCPKTKPPHACPLGRSSEKKLPADFLFWFHLHMTPRLWEDVLELQKQAKLKDNVIFSAQGAPKKVGRRRNQKRKSAGNFFSLDLPNGQAWYILSIQGEARGVRQLSCVCKEPTIIKSRRDRENIFFD